MGWERKMIMKGACIFDILDVSKYWWIYEEPSVILEWIEENCKKKKAIFAFLSFCIVFSVTHPVVSLTCFHKLLFSNRKK